MVQALREWWQRQTGEEETPFDGDSPAFLASMFVHLAVLLILGFIPIVVPDNQITLSISTEPDEKFEELKLPEEFYFSDQAAEEVGANSVNGDAVALSMASMLSEISAIPNHLDFIPQDDANISVEINNAIEVATGLNYNANLAVKGAAGEGTTGAVGAIDRITHEVLLSLEERKTLVVWVLDGTFSLIPQRNAIRNRFDRIYQELGVIEAAGNDAFTKHDDKPLLSAVVAFGGTTHLMTKEPTDNLAELKQAVADIKNDDSGLENVFAAVNDVAKKFASYRYTTGSDDEPERNVMIVVFTDEAGSDVQRLEETIKMCRRWTMPVYVVGVPAPFGRKETLMKWVDPDPKFDQSPQWGVVEQGPESFMPERIKLAFSGSGADEEPMDSGFGPFALTRLCVETGGIYFSVHPNRDTRRAVSQGDTENFSAHLKYFFDSETMRKYRPDYVSVPEYQKRVSQNKARLALVQAAAASQLNQMDNPRLRFVKRDEAEFAQSLTEAQQAAARLEPKIALLYDVLAKGEGDRERESIPRWQAGYDLAMGRTLAVKVRTEAYNAMLAAAKRGLKAKDPKNNTWVLKPDDEISVGSALAKQAEKARMYLNRVGSDHPGTPWAMLAQRELSEPLGWKWEEDFTDLTPRAMGDGNGNAAPANDARMMLPRAKPAPPPRKL